MLYPLLPVYLSYYLRYCRRHSAAGIGMPVHIFNKRIVIAIIFAVHRLISLSIRVLRANLPFGYTEVESSAVTRFQNKYTRNARVVITCNVPACSTAILLPTATVTEASARHFTSIRAAMFTSYWDLVRSREPKIIGMFLICVPLFSLPKFLSWVRNMQRWTRLVRNVSANKNKWPFLNFIFFI